MSPIQLIHNYYFEPEYFDDYVPKNVKTLWKTFFMLGNFKKNRMESPQGCYKNRGTCSRYRKI